MQAEHQRLEEDDRKLSERMHELEKGQKSIGTELVVFRTVVIGLVIALVISFFKSAAGPVIIHQGSPSLETPPAAAAPANN